MPQRLSDILCFTGKPLSTDSIKPVAQSIPAHCYGQKKTSDFHSGDTTGTGRPADDRNESFDTTWSKGVKTLIAEDDIIDQKLAATNARHFGLNVTVVATAAEAIDRIKGADSERSYQLLLIDFKMPSIDGLAASNLIKHQLSLKSPPKIILTSSYHRDEIFTGVTKRECIDEFITKPITVERLEATLNSLRVKSADDIQPWPMAADGTSGTDERNDERLARTHVLLAEDNVINQKVATGILKQKGVQVTVVNNGEEAVEKVLNSNPGTFDIILMDLDMPVKDGCQAAEIILANPAYQHIPIIALTAHIAPEEKQRCLDIGMIEYLTKPVKPQLLYQTILNNLVE